MKFQKNHSTKEAYAKAINICKEHGPSKEYINLINIMGKVAGASNGIDQNEQNVIDDLKKDLTTRFRKDLEKLDLLKE